MELLEYRCVLYNHIFWKSREQFALLMENYVHNSSDFEEFETVLSQLWWERMKVYDVFEIDLKGVENLQLDPRSDEFGSLVISIYRQFEVLEDEECTEQEVKNYI